MTFDDFQKLKKKMVEELKVNEENVQQKSISISNLYMSVLSVYNKERYEFKKLECEKDKLYGELFHHYKYGGTPQTQAKYGKQDYQLDTKTEIDPYIKSNPDYYDLVLKMAQIENQVNFLEQSLQNINNMGFRIKNYVELLKISKGLM
jgi:hypothetical protein